MAPVCQARTLSSRYSEFNTEDNEKGHREHGVICTPNHRNVCRANALLVASPPRCETFFSCAIPNLTIRDGRLTLIFALRAVGMPIFRESGFTICTVRFAKILHPPQF